MRPTELGERTSRELELELVRVRAEAAAVRLEARAAEIELLLLELTCPGDSATASPPTPAANRGNGASPWPPADKSVSALLEALAAPADGQDRYATAEGLIAAIRQLLLAPQPALPRDDHAAEPPSSIAATSASPELLTFLSNGQATAAATSAGPSAAANAAGKSLTERHSREADSRETPSRVAHSREAPSHKAPSRDPLVLPSQQRPGSVTPAELQLAESPSTAPTERPLRPAAWLVSAIGHALLLVTLGLMSLAAQPPRDQMAFSAAAAEVSEQVIDTFTIETSDLSAEETPPQPTEAVLEVSPVGTLPLAEVSLELPDVMPLATADLFSSQASSMTSMSRSPRGDTESNVQFAGVAGGGNHFVYLVDSSQSMRKFNEARMELLRSIDGLKNDQRFYVVFYDQDPDRMRLSDPGLDEPTSVLATPANKAALRRWAMTIRQQRGKSPIDILPFAFRLRPDTIFLLSDGEFSVRTEEVIREHNRRDNLFGEDGPVSIIHTIRFPGATAAEARNAEVQMQRIAQENGGQYRNVVIP